MASFRDLLKQAKSQIREVDPAGAEALLAKGALLLDVLPRFLVECDLDHVLAPEAHCSILAQL